MRILVTGGAGFIGSHIVETFQGKAEIRVLDNLRSGFLKNLDGFNVEFIEGSILDKTLLDRAMEGVDYVFHLAAMISVPESMSKPQECLTSPARSGLWTISEVEPVSATIFFARSLIVITPPYAMLWTPVASLSVAKKALARAMSFT